MTSREVIKLLKKDGWYEVGADGSHLHLKHKEKSGKVTVPSPKKDLPIKTLRSISKQSGVNFN